MRITAGDVADLIERLTDRYGDGIPTHEDEQIIRLLDAAPREMVIGSQWRFEYKVSDDETITRDFDSKESALHWISMNYGGQSQPSSYIGASVLCDYDDEMSLNELL